MVKEFHVIPVTSEKIELETWTFLSAHWFIENILPKVLRSHPTETSDSFFVCMM